MTAFDYNRDEMLNDRPIINGQVMPRNAFRGRPFYDVTARLQKHFALPNERGRITASVDFFNLFGFDNVAGRPYEHDVWAGNRHGRRYPCLKRDRTWSLVRPGDSKDIRGWNAGQCASSGELQSVTRRRRRVLQETLPGDPFQVQVGLRFPFLIVVSRQRD